MVLLFRVRWQQENTRQLYWCGKADATMRVHDISEHAVLRRRSPSGRIQCRHRFRENGGNGAGKPCPRSAKPSSPKGARQTRPSGIPRRATSRPCFWSCRVGSSVAIVIPDRTRIPTFAAGVVDTALRGDRKTVVNVSTSGRDLVRSKTAGGRFIAPLGTSPARASRILAAASSSILSRTSSTAEPRCGVRTVLVGSDKSPSGIFLGRSLRERSSISKTSAPYPERRPERMARNHGMLVDYRSAPDVYQAGPWFHLCDTFFIDHMVRFR